MSKYWYRPSAARPFISVQSDLGILRSRQREAYAFTNYHKNNLIYITKQEGLYQNKVTVSLATIHNCKMA